VNVGVYGLGAPTKLIEDETLKKWLNEFNKETTQRVYSSSIRKFKKNLGIKDIGEYLESKPDFTADIKKFLHSLEGRPSKTISSYVGALKVFLTDHNIKFEENNWRKLKRRGLMPKRVIAETRDKSPTKRQLKKILNYLDIKGKALVLFLISSGCRIGEALSLKEEDFNFNSEPPSVHLRGKYTKAGIGERTVYFSFEARDSIKDWLAIKNVVKKKNGKKFDLERVFSWGKTNTQFMWNTACDKAGLGVKDKNTGRRVYHIHSLRKFFRTKIGLDLDITHALMGHSEYLDNSYVRTNQTEIAKAYLKAIPNVSVFEMQENEELKERATNIENENRLLREELDYMKNQFSLLKDNMKFKLEFLGDELRKYKKNFVLRTEPQKPTAEEIKEGEEWFNSLSEKTRSLFNLNAQKEFMEKLRAEERRKKLKL
jgi:integrase